MFNLLVTGGEGAWDEPSYSLEKDRFLEYTDKDLAAQFTDLGDAAMSTLRHLPSLFAYETRVGQAARVGWIKTVLDRGLHVGITYGFDPGIAPIAPEQILSLAVALDLGRLEMNRTHWALKRARLLDVLRSAGLAQEAAAATEGHEPLVLSRGTIIAACDALQKLGHGGLDRFLLEMGLSGMNAGREQGGLLPRVNALAQFVLSHKDLRTADGDPIEAAIVRKAVDTDAGREAKFWVSLERDGYTWRDDRIVPARDEALPPYRPATTPKAGPPPASAAPSSPEIGGPDLSRSLPAAPVDARASSPLVTPNGARLPKVFVVHGRDHGAKETVARYLERLGLDAVILHERANQGRTLISKFQEESADVAFAVVMMTPDDVGGLKPEKGDAVLRDRARQNVVFELGFFIGRLGANKVCALVSGDVEKPSDFDAVVYIDFGQRTDWRRELAAELRAANVPFDHSKVF